MEAAQCLGYFAAPLQLSKLGNHPNINKWSRCKFVGYTGPSYDNVEDLEEFMDRAFDGWGFTMDRVGHMNTDNEMFGSAVTLSKGEVWHYSGHTPTVDYPVRLGDMRHYNSAAECPYLPVEFEREYTPGVEGHYGPRVILKWRMNDSQNVEINPYLNSNLNSGTYHILLKPASGNTGISVGSSQVTESFTGMSSSTITMESGQTGDYEACAAIYKSNTSEVFPLPNTYFKFNVRNMSEEEYVGISLTNLCSLTRRTAGGATGDLLVHFRVRNLTNETITANTSCRVYDSKAVNPTEPFQYTTLTITIPAYGSVDVWGTENNQLTTTQQYDFKVEDINSMTLPIMGTCTATNAYKSDVVLTKTNTLLAS